MMEKRIIITGASGFVGSTILKYLRDKGFKTIGMIRETSNIDRLKGCEKNIIKANLNDVKSIEEIIEGSYCVIHCAARSLDWGKKAEFKNANIGMTINVANACKSKRIPMFILMSTANVAGYGKTMKTEEDSENSNLKFLYSKTKLIAEKKASEIVKNSKTALIILRPSAIYGPGDTKWSLKMVKMVEDGRWPIINGGKTRFTPLYIGNLCHAVENILTADRKKFDNRTSILNLTDDRIITWIDFCNIIADKLKVSPSYRNFPFLFALTSSAIIQGFCWLTGYKLEPPLTIYRVIRAGRDFLYSCEKAKNDIGYNPDRNIEAHIQKTVRWYKNKNHLKK